MDSTEKSVVKRRHFTNRPRLCLFVPLFIVSLGFAQDALVDPLPGRINRDIQLRRISLDSYRSQHPPSFLETTGDFRLLGRWAWGVCRTVCLVDHYALIGQGFVYQVFDISNPTSPTVIYDTTLTQNINHIEIRDSTLFIIQSGQVLLCDASSYFPLIERGRVIPSAGYLTGMTVSDSILYLMADWVGAMAYSIADISRPYFLSGYQWGNESGNAAIASKGDFVYFAPLGFGEYLHILQRVPDSSGFRVGGLGSVHATPAHSVMVYDSLLVVGWGLGELDVYTIANPWEPRQLGGVEIGSTVFSIARKEERLYCSAMDSTISTVDISDPSNPVILLRRRTAHSIATNIIIKDTLLATTGHEFQLYSITPADSLRDVYYYPTGGYPYSIKMRKNIGYVACDVGGLWSVNFSDPAHPRPIQNVALDSWGLALSGGKAYCLTVNPRTYLSQLSILSITDDGAMSLVSSTDLGVSAYEWTSIAGSDSSVYLGFRDSVVSYQSVNPLEPTRRWSWTAGNHAANQLSLTRDHLFVAQGGGDGSGALWILDVGYPDSARALGRLLSNVRDVCSSDTLVVAVTDSALAVVDVSNPLDPVIVGESPQLGFYPISRDGQFVYCNRNGAVQVFDITHPTDPINVGAVTDLPLGGIDDLYAVNHKIFIVDRYTGVWIVENDLVADVLEYSREKPAEIQLLQNYPNPCNPNTVIRYSLPRAGKVELEVFDLLGRQVAVLVDALQEPGNYSLEFKVRNLASGVYIYRLRQGMQSVARKLIIMK